MLIEYLSSLIFLLIVFTVTQGYGLITKKIIFQKYEFNNISEIGFLGFFSLFSLSIFIHFFVALSFITNSIIIFLGLFFFIYFFYDNFRKDLKYFLIITIFLSVLCIAIEYHSDYFWYHLPYINYLNQYKIIFGVTNLNDFFGYGHGWLDIISLFTLPIYDNNFSIIVTIIFISYYLYNLFYIFKNIQDSTLKIFSILSGIFFFFQYPLIKDYGAEIQSNLIYIIIFINIYLFTYNLENNRERNFTIILLLIIFSFFLRLNSIIFLPLVFFFFLRHLKFSLNYVKKNKIIISFFIFSILILVLKNLIISGCFAYPIYFTCFDEFSWSTGISQAYERYLMLSAQSKGYLLYMVYEIGYESIYKFYLFTENKLFLSPKDYLDPSFQWVEYWIKYEHDKARLLNIIMLLIITLFLCKLFYFKKLSSSFNFNIINRNKWLLLIFFLPIISYLYLLPQGRYGGFGILFVFVAFITSLLINNFKNNERYVLLSILSISIIYFGLKNLNNINYLSIYENYPIENYKYIYTKEYDDNLFLNLKKTIIEGKPNYCNNIKGLCSSQYRESCIKNIKINQSYIFVESNKKNCSNLIKKYFFF